jgi:DNA-binding response OmpR family regulator
MKVLVADDDRDFATIVAYTLRATWPDWQVTLAADGAQALRRFAEERPDLVILDVSMPPPDGFEVCRRIRETSRVPILMLTARDTTLDEVQALDLGADGYLTKPFDHLKLLAHLRALLRRASEPPASGRATGRADFAVGDLAIDFATREVRVAGEVVELTPTEYVLLEELARHAGMVLSRRQLLEQVWGPQYTDATPLLRTHIANLRRKLEPGGGPPRYIRTDPGVGYRFAA